MILDIEPLIDSYCGTHHNDFGVKVHIGQYTSIANELVIVASQHPMGRNVSVYPFKERWSVNYTKSGGNIEPIVIGNDVWIGRNVMLFEGITIGDGAIIGAGAVVAKNIPPYAIAIGNPVRILRYRFSEEQTAKLLRIRWWEWDKLMIRMRIEDFKDIDVFIQKYGGDL